MNKELKDKIDFILNSGMENSSKRIALNQLEKKYPQDLFIKTHLCKGCNSLSVEIWIKTKDKTLN